MAERIIAGLRVSVVHPGLYRIVETLVYIGYIPDGEHRGWWVVKGKERLHRKPFRSDYEAALAMKATYA
jgi:hypothetical protein